jgi:hypothetical protein
MGVVVVAVLVAVAAVAAEGVGAVDPLDVPPPAQEEDCIFALVSGPTLPMGLMPCALWNAATAFSVTDPK